MKRALEAADLCIQVAGAETDELTTSCAVLNLAAAHYQGGSYVEAVEAADRALQYSGGFGDRKRGCEALVLLAAAHRELGELARAPRTGVSALR